MRLITKQLVIHNPKN